MTVLGYLFRKLMHYFYKIDNCDLPVRDADSQDTAGCELQGFHLGTGEEIHRDFQFTHYPDKIGVR